MQEFDKFSLELFEEAARFLEKSKEEETQSSAQTAYIHASLLLAISSLEAFVNAISEELLVRDEFNVAERSLLSEKGFTLHNGKFVINDQLKMSRIIDRVEFLYCKFSKTELDVNATWLHGIKNSIKVRNDLVHPKESVIITQKQVEIALKSILETINVLYVEIYGRRFPRYNFGVQSKLDF